MLCRFTCSPLPRIFKVYHFFHRIFCPHNINETLSHCPEVISFVNDEHRKLKIFTKKIRMKKLISTLVASTLPRTLPRTSTLLSYVAGGTALTLSFGVYAGTTDATDKTPMQRVEVTGSLIRASDRTEYNQVQRVTAADIQESGASTVADFCVISAPTRAVVTTRAQCSINRRARQVLPYVV